MISLIRNESLKHLLISPTIKREERGTYMKGFYK